MLFEAWNLTLREDDQCCTRCRIVGLGRGRKNLLTEPKVLHQHQKGKRLTTGGEGRPQQRQIGPKKNKTKTSKLREKACNPYMQSYSKCHNEALQRNASSQKLSAEAISPRQHVKKISKPDNLTQIKTSTPGPVKVYLSN